MGENKGIVKRESATVLNIGERLTTNELDDIFPYLRSLNNELESGQTLEFNLSNCDYVTPSGIIVLVAFRDIFKKKGVETMVRYIPDSGFIKFFSAIYTISKEMELDSYVKSIKNYAVGLRRCMNENECADVQQEIIEQVVKRTGCTKGTRCAISYMIDEIWVNSGTHGYECYGDKEEFPRPVYFTAFSYKDRVEVAILDLGIGIHKSLRKNEEYRNLNAKQTLAKALEEGSSGHPDRSPGFGLYSASQFTSKQNGSLKIWSSGRNLVWKKDQLNTWSSDFYEGTLVVFEIYKDVDIPFADIVKSRDIDYYSDLLNLY